MSENIVLDDYRYKHLKCDYFLAQIEIDFLAQIEIDFFEININCLI